jgi:hypothetical protein
MLASNIHLLLLPRPREPRLEPDWGRISEQTIVLSFRNLYVRMSENEYHDARRTSVEPRISWDLPE